MDNINFPTVFVYLLLITFSILCLITFLVVVIIKRKKKRSVKGVIITFLAIMASLSIVAGFLALNDYQKDKWFYDLKSQVLERYKIVNNVDFRLGLGHLNLDIYCENTQDEKQTGPVFNLIKNYLFNTKSGSRPSQQSYLMRGKGEYTEITIFFHFENDRNEIITYYGSYYSDVAETKVDNFSTWYIQQNGQEKRLDIKLESGYINLL